MCYQGRAVLPLSFYPKLQLLLVTSPKGLSAAAMADAEPEPISDSQASRDIGMDVSDDETGAQVGFTQGPRERARATPGGLLAAADKPLPAPAVAVAAQPQRSISISTSADALSLDSQSTNEAAAGVAEAKPAAAEKAPLQDSGTSQDSAAALVIDGPAAFAAFETALRIEAVKYKYYERIKDDAIRFFYDKKDEFDTAFITFFDGGAASGRITVSSLKKALKESRADVSEQTYSQFAADFDDFGQRSPNAAEPSEGDESEVATPPYPYPPYPL